MTDLVDSNGTHHGARSPLQLDTLSIRLEELDKASGWDLNHPYLETFWLPVIGPTSTLLLRYVGRHVRSSNYTVFDTSDVALCLGVGAGIGRHSPIVKTVQRLARFDLARVDSVEDDPNLRLTVDSHVPPVPPGFQRKWPEHLRVLHSRAVARQHIAVAQERS